MQDHCRSYGETRAHADLKGLDDAHHHVGSNKTTGGHSFADVRKISFCIDESKPCWKDQVEPVGSGNLQGQVRFVTVHASNCPAGYEYARTHEERYAGGIHAVACFAIFP